MSKQLLIGSVRNGTCVELLVPGNQYKNIEVIHSNDCGCHIKGLHKIDGVFKPLGNNFTISNSTPVRMVDPNEVSDIKETESLPVVDEEKEKIRLIKELIGMGVDLTSSLPQELLDTINSEPVVKTPKAKNISDLIFPNGNFTMDELASINGLSKANAYIKMKKYDNVVVVEQKASKRGRPTNIYRAK